MKPELWPVIHVDNSDHAIEDVRMVMEAGCDGAWLIQMHGRDWILPPILERIRAEVSPTFQVGVNFLSMLALASLSESLKLGFDATWVDNCGVHSTGCSYSVEYTSALLSVNPKHKFFGSVAFKYQKHEPDPCAAARLAHDYGFIPTTSGSATGSPPELEKLRQMYEVSGRLAIASGIDKDNIGQLGEFVSHVFVASSISNSDDRLDRGKLLELKAEIDKL